MWIALNHKKQGTYPVLRYGRGKVFSLGKLPDSPTGLLDLVLEARKHTRSIAVLEALRDADKSMRN
jgi:hypothetical protein